MPPTTPLEPTARRVAAQLDRWAKTGVAALTGVTNDLMDDILKDIQHRVRGLEEMRGEMHHGFAGVKTLLASPLPPAMFSCGRRA